MPETRSSSTHLSKIVAAALVVFFVAACSMFDGRESAGEYFDDAGITSQVKTDILGDPNLKVLEINVETMQGVVQLSGFVDKPQSELKAVELARSVKGVKSVKDNLVVR